MLIIYTVNMKSVFTYLLMIHHVVLSFCETPKVVQYDDGESIEFSFGGNDSDYDLEMLQNRELASFNLASVKEKLQLLHKSIENSVSHERISDVSRKQISPHSQIEHEKDLNNYSIDDEYDDNHSIRGFIEASDEAFYR